MTKVLIIQINEPCIRETSWVNRMSRKYVTFIFFIKLYLRNIQRLVIVTNVNRVILDYPDATDIKQEQQVYRS